jgi:hypothetical protein
LRQPGHGRLEVGGLAGHGRQRWRVGEGVRRLLHLFRLLRGFFEEEERDHDDGRANGLFPADPLAEEEIAAATPKTGMVLRIIPAVVTGIRTIA